MLEPARPPAPRLPSVRPTELVDHAVKAPSSHNTQPWRFRLGDDGVAFYADRSRALPVNDPENRELTISCGAALFNLRVAAAHRGVRADVDVMPDRRDADLLADVSLDGQRAPSPGEARLFFAIGRRRTCRTWFADRHVPRLLAGALTTAAHAEGCRLEIVGDDAGRAAVADLVAEGDRVLFGDSRWRRELACWMRRSHTGGGLPLPRPGGRLARALVARFDLGRRMAARDRRLVETAPLVAVLSSPGDSPGAWLATGQALQRVLLTAAARGVQAGFLNQPCQVPELRLRLQRLLGHDGVPQLLLRLGYPTDSGSQAPRRPAAAVTEGLGPRVRVPPGPLGTSG